MNAATPTATLAIVHYQSPDALLGCLANLPDRPVVVLDNGSSRAAHAAVAAGVRNLNRAGIMLHRSEANLGFGGGCNWLWRNAVPDDAGLVFFLNPDTIVGAGACERLEQALAADPALVAVAPVIERMDSGNIDFAGGEIDWWRGEAHHRVAPAPGEVAPSAYLTGAAFMVRRQALIATGGFREDLFLYWEDVDLSLRLRRHGRLGVVAGARIRHIVSPGLAGSSDRYYYSARNALLTVRRHHPWLWPLCYWRYARVQRDLERRDQHDAATAVAEALADFRSGVTGPRQSASG